MATAKSKSGISPRALDAERVLEEYYDKLQHWGVVLSRGDRTMAQEIVHDLCLHFIVARPDLSQVANLDGYLYTCLRHLYLSAIARSSREALQTVSIADFDSVQFALDARTSDGLLDRQNEHPSHLQLRGVAQRLFKKRQLFPSSFLSWLHSARGG